MGKLREAVPSTETVHRFTTDDRRSRLALDAAGLSHPGRRRLNQDQFLVADLAGARLREGEPGRDGATQESLLVVADGMGGHPCGEVASLLAVRVLVRELLQAGRDPGNPGRRLELALRSSDEALHRAGRRRDDLASMGTTLTAAWWIPPMLYFAHVGHSRLYLLHGGELSRLTRDHTFGAGITEAGLEHSQVGPFDHVLTQALGGDRRGIDPEAGCRRLDRGDVVLLCTDGLVRGVDDVEIARTLGQARTAHDAAAALLASALAADDHDNITALVARVETPVFQSVTGRANA